MKIRRFNIVDKEFDQISNPDKEEEEKLVNNSDGIMKAIDILKLNHQYHRKFTGLSDMNQK